MAKMLTSDYVSALARDMARTCKTVLLATGASIHVTPVVGSYECKITFTFTFPDDKGVIKDQKRTDFIGWANVMGLGNITKDDIDKVVVSDEGKSYKIVGAVKGTKPIVMQDLLSRNLIKVSLKDAHKLLHRKM